MKSPWHLWVVGILSLAWNAIGAVDYTMTETRNAAYMAQFTPEQLQYFYGFPTWVVAAWALGVWGSVAGSVLLLMRSKLAVWAFLASLVGVAATDTYSFVLSPVSSVDLMGPAAMAFAAVIAVVVLGLYIYARAMKMRGVLR